MALKIQNFNSFDEFAHLMSCLFDKLPKWLKVDELTFKELTIWQVFVLPSRSESDPGWGWVFFRVRLWNLRPAASPFGRHFALGFISIICPAAIPHLISFPHQFGDGIHELGMRKINGRGDEADWTGRTRFRRKGHFPGFGRKLAKLTEERSREK